jgi:hypothetical protein
VGDIEGRAKKEGKPRPFATLRVTNNKKDPNPDEPEANKDFHRRATVLKGKSKRAITTKDTTLAPHCVWCSAVRARSTTKEIEFSEIQGERSGIFRIFLVFLRAPLRSFVFFVVKGFGLSLPCVTSVIKIPSQLLPAIFQYPFIMIL